MSEELDKLDRLAAEKVMGWSSDDDRAYRTFDGSYTSYAELGATCGDDEPWIPTRNIAQAWELLERFITENLLGTEHYKTQIDVRTVNGIYAPVKWSACLWVRTDDPDSEYEKIRHYAEADTAPLAIVKACLKAKGVRCE